MMSAEGVAKRKKWMDKSARLGKAMADKNAEQARVPRPDWMNDPSLLPKRPPGRG